MKCYTSIDPEFFHEALLNAVRTEMVKARHDVVVDFERCEARWDAKAAKALEQRDKKMLRGHGTARLLKECRRRPPPTPSSSDDE